MKKITLGCVTLLAVSLSGQAKQNNELHRLGVDFSAASASYRGSSLDGDGVGQAYLYYNYQVMPKLTFELGYTNGADLDDWHCKDDNDRQFTCNQNNKSLFGLGADELEYANVTFAAKSYYPVTENSYLYGKLGLTYFGYKFFRDGNKLGHDNGIGYVLEAGWQYDWNNGMAVNAGYRHQGMQDLDISGFTLGVSYRF
ncbi:MULTISPECIES: outer membrane beta-barrel protein [unclassified Pseudoalteromonas]|uniref:outer membrane beta-barrel protein n=1 Tax=unclassified Pseudoalteromonas TaxID=194690 RepID=UPI003014C810